VIRHFESNHKVETELRRSKTVRVAKDYGLNYAAYTLEEDPTNLQEALSYLHPDLRQEVINDSLESKRILVANQFVVNGFQKRNLNPMAMSINTRLACCQMFEAKRKYRLL
jgi:hypothetical protein